ncbi:MAG: hypothetical protein WCO56_12580 [Verrucomicrobiota bacterium]
MQRIAQPPINPVRRDSEHHDFLPGFIPAVIGALLLFIGSRHLTSLDTTAGNSAWETQLVKAIANSGLQIVPPAPPPDPASLDDPVKAAAAFQQMDQQFAQPYKLKYRINTGAKAACPT